MSLPCVDVHASYSHYKDHMQPIFDALPGEVQGKVHPVGDLLPREGHVAMVAGYKDARVLGRRVPVIYVEHGAGQVYAGDANPAVRQHPSYSGSGGHRFENVLCFICPSQAVADRWETAEALAVGCPKLDKWRNVQPTNPYSVCFTFHWEGTLCPENGTAWWHYAAAMPEIVCSLQESGLKVFGHSHPRWNSALDGPMKDAGMTLLKFDADVFRHAGALIADNTSLLPEMASLGRPVLFLNAPWYRRGVEHGGRFWEWPDHGWSIDNPQQLVDFDVANWIDAPIALTMAGELAAEVYAHNDDLAAKRAASFIVERILEM